MIFKQVFDQKSSTYTYLIASAKGREALIIDPVLENVENYIKLLNELNLKLTESDIRYLKSLVSQFTIEEAVQIKEIEKKTNPFLRSDDKEIRLELGMMASSRSEVFAEIRSRKDQF